MRERIRFAVVVLALIAELPLAHPMRAAGADATASQVDSTIQTANVLKQMSLEELFDLTVTTVSSKPEPVSKTAAAVHIVTADEIRRLGALNIPRVLRYVPGVEVARVSTRDYAITARGFNGTIANKLLVMIDGRSVYTPLFSGVFWDAQDAFMEDIAQIEVIRGPGATVWGANAVNGVINVIRKDAAQTQGLLVTGGAGISERGFGGARYGGRLGSKGFFRVYGKADVSESVQLPSGADSEDEFRMIQGGARAEWTLTSSDALTLQGDLYDGRGKQRGAGDITLGGANGMARWTRSFSANSDLQVAAYYDRTDRSIPFTFAEILDTWDATLRHRFALGRHELIWGLGYRYLSDDVDNGPMLAFLPSEVDHRIVSGFVQGDIRIVPDRFSVTVGSKIENNDYTGTEYQPSARFTWTPSARHTLWGAVSRPVRTPSRIDRDLHIPANPPFLLAGGPGFKSELLRAYELGYKTQPTRGLSASVAAFHNRYESLRSLELGTTRPTSRMV